MKIRINGHIRDVKGPTTIQDLLVQLGYANHFVAVAVNQNCIPKQKFPEQSVQDQDEVEILAPMAGG